MRNIPIYEALYDIRELKRRIVDRTLFQGYSGVARMTGGTIAIVGMLIMSLPFYPKSPTSHIIGWGIICVLAGGINFFGLFSWYRSNRQDISGLQDLRPLLDLLAPFLIGAILTQLLIARGLFDLLPGTWMSLFGLMNIASRHSVPRTTFFLGWYYVLAGFLSFYSGLSFLDPRPMGLVFGIGELTGGYIFYSSKKVRL